MVNSINSTKEEKNIMKSKQLFSSVLAVLFVFPLLGAFAEEATHSGSIQVITTFDYPGTGNATLPQKINELGDIVGEFIDPSGVVRGFTRFNNGSFSSPIVDPNDTVGFTEGRGINNFRKVIGDYVASDGFVHSFSLFANTFTEYDVPGAVQTNLLGINELGDLTGAFDPDGSGVFQGFIDRHGNITSFSVPDGVGGTLAYELNDTRRLTVGYYIDASGVLHGYYRDHNGALHFPIDPPGSVATVLFGVNDTNFVVGRYADAAGATHGLFFVPPDNFFTFDFPGSSFTSLNGINLFGFICGRYNDAAGVGHGFIARLRGIPHGNGANQLATPSTPASLGALLHQSPSGWGGATPER
jgi:hypothetical protein